MTTQFLVCAKNIFAFVTFVASMTGNPGNFIDRRGRQGDCTVVCATAYTNEWCACSQREVKRSREDGEG